MRWMKGLNGFAAPSALVFALVFALAFSPAKPVLAQPAPFSAGGRAGQGQHAHKDRVRMRLLRRRVGLDEAKARRVIAVIRSHGARRAEIMRRMRQQKRTIGRLLRQNSNDEGAYRNAIDALMHDQQAMASLRIEEMKELRKALTPKEQAKLLFELNRLAKRRRRGAGAPGGPPPRGKPPRGRGARGNR